MAINESSDVPGDDTSSGYLNKSFATRVLGIRSSWDSNSENQYCVTSRVLTVSYWKVSIHSYFGDSRHISLKI